MLNLVILVLAIIMLTFVIMTAMRRSFFKTLGVVAFNMIFGLGTLLLLSEKMPLGVDLPVNAVTVSIAGFLGAPGTGLLYAMKWFMM